MDLESTVRKIIVYDSTHVPLSELPRQPDVVVVDTSAFGSRYAEGLLAFIDHGGHVMTHAAVMSEVQRFAQKQRPIRDQAKIARIGAAVLGRIGKENVETRRVRNKAGDRLFAKSAGLLPKHNAVRYWCESYDYLRLALAPLQRSQWDQKSIQRMDQLFESRFGSCRGAREILYPALQKIGRDELLQAREQAATGYQATLEANVGANNSRFVGDFLEEFDSHAYRVAWIQMAGRGSETQRHNLERKCSTDTDLLVLLTALSRAREGMQVALYSGDRDHCYMVDIARRILAVPKTPCRA